MTKPKSDNKDHPAGTYWRGPTFEHEMRAAWDAARQDTKLTFDAWFAKHVLGRYITPDDPTWNRAEYAAALKLGACSPLPLPG